MWPATVTISVRSASGRPADDDLLGEPVDEVRAVDVPADVEPDERDATPVLDGDDLAEQDRRVLATAGRPARRRSVTPSGPRWRARTAAYASRSTACSSWRAGAPSPPPTLTSPIRCPAARSRSTASTAASERRARTRRGRRPASPNPAWKWTVSIARSWRARRRDRVVEPLEARSRTSSAGRRRTRGARCSRRRRPGRSRMPDRRPRRPPAVALDLADRVEVEVDAAREQDVEVALGDVRARCS